GKNMGDIADEFDGGKCITFTGLALKTYNQIYVTPQGEVLDVTRCKGIPHKSEPIKVREIIMNSEKDYRRLQKILDFQAEPDFGGSLPITNLGVNDIIYHFKSNDSTDECVTNHLGHEMFQKILNKEGNLTTYSGAIRRFL